MAMRHEKGRRGLGRVARQRAATLANGMRVGNCSHGTLGLRARVR